MVISSQKGLICAMIYQGTPQTSLNFQTICADIA